MQINFYQEHNFYYNITIILQIIVIIVQYNAQC